MSHHGFLFPRSEHERRVSHSGIAWLSLLRSRLSERCDADPHWPLGLAATVVFLRGLWGRPLGWLMILLVRSLACQEIVAAQSYGSPPVGPSRRPSEGACREQFRYIDPWNRKRDVEINREFNDYAGIYLDSASAECKEIAAKALIVKLEGTLNFADAGGTVMSPQGRLSTLFTTGCGELP